MSEYSVQKDGKYITGNINAGRYVFTSNCEHRYIFSEGQAQKIAEQFPGSVIVKE
jgi:hypothetical protein